MLGCGRCGDSLSRGFAWEITKNSTALSMPITVACRSPSFTPCTAPITASRHVQHIEHYHFWPVNVGRGTLHLSELASGKQPGLQSLCFTAAATPVDCHLKTIEETISNHIFQISTKCCSCLRRECVPMRIELTIAYLQALLTATQARTCTRPAAMSPLHALIQSFT